MIVCREENDGYALLVDYELELCTSSTSLHMVKIERDLWRGPVETLHQLPIGSDRIPLCHLRFRLKALQTLSAQDLRLETTHRNFAILSGNETFYVDVQYLSEWDGVLTDQLRETCASGRRRAVVQQLTSKQLWTLLDALCTFRQLVVTRRNFDDLLWICAEMKMNRVLRAVEAFLIDLKWMHPIRKLELAILSRCSRLGDAALRQLGNPLQALTALHQFLDETGSTSLNDIHPDLLVALNIYPDYVIIG